MPEVIATCPHCQKKLKLKSEKMLGKKVNCRNCDTPFVLKAESSQKTKSSRKRQPSASESDFDDAYDSSQIRARRLRKRKGSSSTKSKPQESSKKKTASKEGDAKLPLPLLIGGSILGMAIMAGLGYFVYSKGSTLNPGGAANNNVVAPAKFVKFEPEVGDFGCEYPEGWTEKSGGGQGGVQSWAKFISPDESTTISIRGNMTGSALGGAGLAMNQGADDDIEPPVVDIHRLMKRKFSDDYSNYEEIGNFQLFKSKMGDTCSSIFTTKSFLGGKQKGLRVTFLTGRVQFNLICLCDEGLFDKMRPAFDQVVQTIHEK
ncbi:hypothetical protein Pan241w_26060 [Gimesia alba]|uniref:Zinc finger/thioredoxin putative domain-containing protein n=1 Tax=Gimesia alba TaxID=2527973 RepID=A0A517RF67_9PLAN|nr:hypothetical protein [Gimesia alba]QDT42522.1 hypothetical protein Pan241w_26060 [Gimesia alba]